MFKKFCYDYFTLQNSRELFASGPKMYESLTADCQCRLKHENIYSRKTIKITVHFARHQSTYLFNNDNNFKTLLPLSGWN